MLDKINKRELEIFKLLSKAAENESMEAFVVGGYVRDLFLKRSSGDIDVVCIGDGIRLAHSFAHLLDPIPRVNFFKNFGTAMLRYKGYDIEFVGARKESYAKESRKPQVSEGSLSDDQKRRDFTINAMAIALNKEVFGQLLDPFDGLADLENKIIRTPLDPELTFSDDPLRMFRAIRFSNQLHFELRPEIIKAIKNNLHRVQILSIERIMGEFQKIMACHQPSKGIKALDETGLLEKFLPELCQMKGVEEMEGISHKDNFYHTLQVLDNICKETDNIWLRWAALLHDIAKPPTKRFSKKEGWTFHGHEIVGARMVYEIFKRLKLPLDHKMKFVQKLVKLHLRPMALSGEEVTDSAVRRILFDAGEDVDALMILCRADITSKNPRRIKRYLENYDRVYEKMKEVEERDKLRDWQPPVDGDLIMKTFAIKPSKEVGIIKTAIREAILEGEIKNNYEDAFAFMLALGKKMGLTHKDK